jgi:hypothetical protein
MAHVVDGQSAAKKATGNVLGELTAEADTAMLSTAFYESRNYRELVGGSDFRFVVGRRGTGKSALCAKVSQAMTGSGSSLVIAERPGEEKVSAWHSELTKLGASYLGARRITRLTWKVQILSQALDEIVGHYTRQLRNSNGVSGTASGCARIEKHAIGGFSTV